MLINKIELDSVLLKAQPFLMQKSFAPILTHFCFNPESVVAFNDIQAIEVKYKSGIECALPGLLAIKMIGSLQNNAIESTQKMDEMQFKSGKTKINIPTLPKEDFVFQMPTTIGCKELRLPLDVISGLSNCLISTSQDLSAPEKNGVRLIIEKGVLEFFSSDAITLSKFKYSSPAIPKDFIDVIIPSMFCEQLVKLTKNKSADIEESAFVDVYISDDDPENPFMIVDVDPTVTIYTRLITVDEPMDFKRIVAPYEHNLTTWTTIPKELDSIVSRACILIAQEDKFITTVEGSDKTIFITTQSKSGRSDDALTFETEVQTGRFKINPETIVRVLSTMSHMCFSFGEHEFIAFKSCNGNFLHLVSSVKAD